MIVNGEDFDMQKLGQASLDALLDHLQLAPETVAIEYNGRILPRQEWSALQLDAADRLELIRFVGGG